MPEDRDIIDERDEDATDSAALARRLQRCLIISEKLVRRLTTIEAGWQSPGPPDGPQILDGIIAQSNLAIDTANRIKAFYRS